MPKNTVAFSPKPNQGTKGGDDLNSEQIEQLEKELWDAADNVRANSKLTAMEYKDPVQSPILPRNANTDFMIHAGFKTNRLAGASSDLQRESNVRRRGHQQNGNIDIWQTCSKCRISKKR